MNGSEQDVSAAIALSLWIAQLHLDLEAQREQQEPSLVPERAMPNTARGMRRRFGRIFDKKTALIEANFGEDRQETRRTAEQLLAEWNGQPSDYKDASQHLLRELIGRMGGVDTTLRKIRLVLKTL